MKYPDKQELCLDSNNGLLFHTLSEKPFRTIKLCNGIRPRAAVSWSE